MGRSVAIRFDGVRGSVRRVLIISAVLALVMVVMVPGGLADAVSGNGRDAGATPGTATDSSKSAPTDNGTSRDNTSVAPSSGLGSAVPSAAIESTGGVAAAVDNGRGGVDPLASPNAVLVAPRTSALIAEVSGVDTDSGVAPVRRALPRARGLNSVSSLGSAEATVDQDVPGAPTSSAPGNDAPSNDSDG